MKSRVFLDLVLIIVLYLFYFGITAILSYVETADMSEALSGLSLAGLGISLACALTWYALGEWVIRSFASTTTWYTVWFLLLLVIFGAATAITLLGVPPLSQDLQVALFVCGGGFYYLATMLFSPFHAQFLIWPSKRVRTW